MPLPQAKKFTLAIEPSMLLLSHRAHPRESSGCRKELIEFAVHVGSDDSIFKRERMLDNKIDKMHVGSEDGVRLALVEDSDHHVQNDVYCEQAAEAFLRRARRL